MVTGSRSYVCSVFCGRFLSIWLLTLTSNASNFFVCRSIFVILIALESWSLEVFKEPTTSNIIFVTVKLQPDKDSFTKIFYFFFSENLFLHVIRNPSRSPSSLGARKNRRMFSGRPGSKVFK